MNRSNLNLIIVLASVFIVRLIYLLEIAQQPDFSILMVDEKFFYLWAQAINEQSFWGEGAYFRAPLYGYFLAFLYLIAGGSIFLMKLLQLLLCIGTAFFLFKLASHLFNKSVATIAGLIYAFYGTAVFYEAMFLIPALFNFLLVWGVYRFIVYQQDRSVISYLLTGLIFGSAAIARPNILLVMPFLLLWLLLTDKATLVSRLKRPVLIGLGLLLPIIPVTARNYVKTGEFILISSQGGINFHLGNNPEANGLTMRMPEVTLDESVSWDQFESVTIQAAEKESGQTLSPAQASSFWTSKTVTYISENPFEFISRTLKKTVYLITGFENSDNADIYNFRNKSTLFSLLTFNTPIYFPFGLLLPLVMIGIMVTFHERKKLLPIYIYLLAYIPSIILFLVTARHRLPLIPFFILIAAVGIYRLYEHIKSKKYTKTIVPGLIFLLLIIVLNRTYFDQNQLDSTFQIHLNNGLKATKLNDHVTAEKEYILAYEAYPYSATLLNNLGYTQYLLGKYGAAESTFQQALLLKSDNVDIHNNYGLLMKTTNRIPQALASFKTAIRHTDQAVVAPEEYANIIINLAETFAQAKEVDSAVYYHQQAVTLAPDWLRSHSTYAVSLLQLNLFTQADSVYAALERTGRMNADSYFNHGLSLIQRKQFTPARKELLKTVSLNNSYFQAFHLIAVSYFEENGPADSVSRYINITQQLNPAYPPSIALQKAFVQKYR